MKYLVLSSVAAYLVGSIPFGYLAGRCAGIDVRQHGSGNIGATNVLRVLGKQYGYSVFAADTLKGFLPVRFALWLGHAGGAPVYFGIVAAVCAVLGHSFPVWLRFRGGKGVATSAGACFGLLPLETAICAAVWIIAFLLLRYVSLASICAVIALPLSTWLLLPPVNTGHRLLLLFSVAIAVLVVLRHRGNIRRLIEGTEPRFSRK
ncbi:MAG: glycerol-3-phosphate 1-O-acyltransferase PlsY [Verrucomicrobia bacterium]|nr:glycerol-3-phosphate 1-O-acyltransferase PlsY [Verrucomicrobiota bacterium]